MPPRGARRNGPTPAVEETSKQQDPSPIPSLASLLPSSSLDITTIEQYVATLDTATTSLPTFHQALLAVCQSHALTLPRLFLALERDLYCGKCRYVMLEPYTLTCGHHLCRDCFRASTSQVCPQCYEQFFIGEIVYSTMLKKAIRVYMLFRQILGFDFPSQFNVMHAVHIQQTQDQQQCQREQAKYRQQQQQQSNQQLLSILSPRESAMLASSSTNTATNSSSSSSQQATCAPIANDYASLERATERCDANIKYILSLEQQCGFLDDSFDMSFPASNLDETLFRPGPNASTDLSSTHESSSRQQPTYATSFLHSNAMLGTLAKNGQPDSNKHVSSRNEDDNSSRLDREYKEIIHMTTKSPKTTLLAEDPADNDDVDNDTDNNRQSSRANGSNDNRSPKTTQDGQGSDAEFHPRRNRLDHIILNNGTVQRLVTEKLCTSAVQSQIDKLQRAKRKEALVAQLTQLQAEIDVIELDNKRLQKQQDLHWDTTITSVKTTGSVTVQEILQEHANETPKQNIVAQNQHNQQLSDNIPQTTVDSSVMDEIFRNDSIDTIHQPSAAGPNSEEALGSGGQSEPDSVEDVYIDLERHSREVQQQEYIQLTADDGQTTDTVPNTSPLASQIEVFDDDLYATDATNILGVSQHTNASELLSNNDAVAPVMDESSNKHTDDVPASDVLSSYKVDNNTDMNDDEEIITSSLHDSTHESHNSQALSAKIGENTAIATPLNEIGSNDMTDTLDDTYESITPSISQPASCLSTEKHADDYVEYGASLDQTEGDIAASQRSRPSQNHALSQDMSPISLEPVFAPLQHSPVVENGSQITRNKSISQRDEVIESHNELSPTKDASQQPQIASSPSTTAATHSPPTAHSSPATTSNEKPVLSLASPQSKSIPTSLFVQMVYSLHLPHSFSHAVNVDDQSQMKEGSEPEQLPSLKSSSSFVVQFQFPSSMHSIPMFSYDQIIFNVLKQHHQQNQLQQTRFRYFLKDAIDQYCHREGIYASIIRLTSDLAVNIISSHQNQPSTTPATRILAENQLGSSSMLNFSIPNTLLIIHTMSSSDRVMLSSIFPTLTISMSISIILGIFDALITTSQLFQAGNLPSPGTSTATNISPLQSACVDILACNAVLTLLSSLSTTSHFAHLYVLLNDIHRKSTTIMPQPAPDSNHPADNSSLISSEQLPSLTSPIIQSIYLTIICSWLASNFNASSGDPYSRSQHIPTHALVDHSSTHLSQTIPLSSQLSSTTEPPIISQADTLFQDHQFVSSLHNSSQQNSSQSSTTQSMSSQPNNNQNTASPNDNTPLGLMPLLSRFSFQMYQPLTTASRSYSLYDIAQTLTADITTTDKAVVPPIHDDENTQDLEFKPTTMNDNVAVSCHAQTSTTPLCIVPVGVVVQDEEQNALQKQGYRIPLAAERALDHLLSASNHILQTQQQTCTSNTPSASPSLFQINLISPSVYLLPFSQSTTSTQNTLQLATSNGSDTAQNSHLQESPPVSNGYSKLPPIISSLISHSLHASIRRLFNQIPVFAPLLVSTQLAISSRLARPSLPPASPHQPLWRSCPPALYASAACSLTLSTHPLPLSPAQHMLSSFLPHIFHSAIVACLRTESATPIVQLLSSLNSTLPTPEPPSSGVKGTALIPAPISEPSCLTTLSSVSPISISTRLANPDDFPSVLPPHWASSLPSHQPCFPYCFHWHLTLPCACSTISLLHSHHRLVAYQQRALRATLLRGQILLFVTILALEYAQLTQSQQQSVSSMCQHPTSVTPRLIPTHHQESDPSEAAPLSLSLDSRLVALLDSLLLFPPVSAPTATLNESPLNQKNDPTFDLHPLYPGYICGETLDNAVFIAPKHDLVLNVPALVSSGWLGELYSNARTPRFSLYVPPLSYNRNTVNGDSNASAVMAAAPEITLLPSDWDATTSLSSDDASNYRDSACYTYSNIPTLAWNRLFRRVVSLFEQPTETATYSASPIEFIPSYLCHFDDVNTPDELLGPVYRGASVMKQYDRALLSVASFPISTPSQHHDVNSQHVSLPKQQHQPSQQIQIQKPKKNASSKPSTLHGFLAAPVKTSHRDGTVLFHDTDNNKANIFDISDQEESDANQNVVAFYSQHDFDLYGDYQPTAGEIVPETDSNHIIGPESQPDQQPHMEFTDIVTTLDESYSIRALVHTIQAYLPQFDINRIIPKERHNNSDSEQIDCLFPISSSLFSTFSSATLSPVHFPEQTNTHSLQSDEADSSFSRICPSMLTFLPYITSISVPSSVNTSLHPEQQQTSSETTTNNTVASLFGRISELRLLYDGSTVLELTPLMESIFSMTGVQFAQMAHPILSAKDPIFLQHDSVQQNHLIVQPSTLVSSLVCEHEQKQEQEQELNVDDPLCTQDEIDTMTSLPPLSPSASLSLHDTTLHLNNQVSITNATPFNNFGRTSSMPRYISQSLDDHLDLTSSPSRDIPRSSNPSKRTSKPAQAHHIVISSSDNDEDTGNQTIYYDKDNDDDADIQKDANDADDDQSTVFLSPPKIGRFPPVQHKKNNDDDISIISVSVESRRPQMSTDTPLSSARPPASVLRLRRPNTNTNTTTISSNQTSLPFQRDSIAQSFTKRRTSLFGNSGGTKVATVGPSSSIFKHAQVTTLHHSSSDVMSMSECESKDVQDEPAQNSNAEQNQSCDEAIDFTTPLANQSGGSSKGDISAGAVVLTDSQATNNPQPPTNLLDNVMNVTSPFASPARLLPTSHPFVSHFIAKKAHFLRIFPLQAQLVQVNQPISRLSSYIPAVPTVLPHHITEDGMHSDLAQFHHSFLCPYRISKLHSGDCHKSQGCSVPSKSTAYWSKQNLIAAAVPLFNSLAPRLVPSLSFYIRSPLSAASISALSHVAARQAASPLSSDIPKHSNEGDDDGAGNDDMAAPKPSFPLPVSETYVSDLAWLQHATHGDLSFHNLHTNLGLFDVPCQNNMIDKIESLITTIRKYPLHSLPLALLCGVFTPLLSSLSPTIHLHAMYQYLSQVQIGFIKRQHFNLSPCPLFYLPWGDTSCGPSPALLFNVENVATRVLHHLASNSPFDQKIVPNNSDQTVAPSVQDGHDNQSSSLTPNHVIQPSTPSSTGALSQVLANYLQQSNSCPSPNKPAYSHQSTHLFSSLFSQIISYLWQSIFPRILFPNHQGSTTSLTQGHHQPPIHPSSHTIHQLFPLLFQSLLALSLCPSELVPLLVPHRLNPTRYTQSPVVNDGHIDSNIDLNTHTTQYNQQPHRDGVPGNFTQSLFMNIPSPNDNFFLHSSYHLVSITAGHLFLSIPNLLASRTQNNCLLYDFQFVQIDPNIQLSHDDVSGGDVFSPFKSYNHNDKQTPHAFARQQHGSSIPPDSSSLTHTTSMSTSVQSTSSTISSSSLFSSNPSIAGSSTSSLFSTVTDNPALSVHSTTPQTTAIIDSSITPSQHTPVAAKPQIPPLSVYKTTVQRPLWRIMCPRTFVIPSCHTETISQTFPTDQEIVADGPIRALPVNHVYAFARTYALTPYLLVSSPNIPTIATFSPSQLSTSQFAQFGVELAPKPVQSSRRVGVSSTPRQPTPTTPSSRSDLQRTNSSSSSPHEAPQVDDVSQSPFISLIENQLHVVPLDAVTVGTYTKSRSSSTHSSMTYTPLATTLQTQWTRKQSTRSDPHYFSKSLHRSTSMSLQLSLITPAQSDSFYSLPSSLSRVCFEHCPSGNIQTSNRIVTEEPWAVQPYHSILLHCRSAVLSHGFIVLQIFRQCMNLVFSFISRDKSTSSTVLTTNDVATSLSTQESLVISVVHQMKPILSTLKSCFELAQRYNVTTQALATQLSYLGGDITVIDHSNQPNQDSTWHVETLLQKMLDFCTTPTHDNESSPVNAFIELVNAIASLSSSSTTPAQKQNQQQNNQTASNNQPKSLFEAELSSLLVPLVQYSRITAQRYKYLLQSSSLTIYASHTFCLNPSIFELVIIPLFNAIHIEQLQLLHSDKHRSQQENTPNLTRFFVAKTTPSSSVSRNKVINPILSQSSTKTMELSSSLSPSAIATTTTTTTTSPVHANETKDSSELSTPSSSYSLSSLRYLPLLIHSLHMPFSRGSPEHLTRFHRDAMRENILSFFHVLVPQLQDQPYNHNIDASRSPSHLYPAKGSSFHTVPLLSTPTPFSGYPHTSPREKTPHPNRYNPDPSYAAFDSLFGIKTAPFVVSPQHKPSLVSPPITAPWLPMFHAWAPRAIIEWMGQHEDSKNFLTESDSVEGKTSQSLNDQALMPSSSSSLSTSTPQLHSVWSPRFYQFSRHVHSSHSPLIRTPIDTFEYAHNDSRAQQHSGLHQHLTSSLTATLKLITQVLPSINTQSQPPNLQTYRFIHHMFPIACDFIIQTYFATCSILLRQSGLESTFSHGLIPFSFPIRTIDGSSPSNPLTRNTLSDSLSPQSHRPISIFDCDFLSSNSLSQMQHHAQSLSTATIYLPIASIAQSTTSFAVTDMYAFALLQEIHSIVARITLVAFLHGFSPIRRAHQLIGSQLLSLWQSSRYCTPTTLPRASKSSSSSSLVRDSTSSQNTQGDAQDVDSFIAITSVDLNKKMRLSLKLLHSIAPSSSQACGQIPMMLYNTIVDPIAVDAVACTDSSKSSDVKNPSLTSESPSIHPYIQTFISHTNQQPHQPPQSISQVNNLHQSVIALSGMLLSIPFFPIKSYLHHTHKHCIVPSSSSSSTTPTITTFGSPSPLTISPSSSLAPHQHIVSSLIYQSHQLTLARLTGLATFTIAVLRGQSESLLSSHVSPPLSSSGHETMIKPTDKMQDDSFRSPSKAAVSSVFSPQAASNTPSPPSSKQSIFDGWNPFAPLAALSPSSSATAMTMAMSKPQAQASADSVLSPSDSLHMDIHSPQPTESFPRPTKPTFSPIFRLVSAFASPLSLAQRVTFFATIAELLCLHTVCQHHVSASLKKAHLIIAQHKKNPNAPQRAEITTLDKKLSQRNIAFIQLEMLKDFLHLSCLGRKKQGSSAALTKNDNADIDVISLVDDDDNDVDGNRDNDNSSESRLHPTQQSRSITSWITMSKNAYLQRVFWSFSHPTSPSHSSKDDTMRDQVPVSLFLQSADNINQKDSTNINNMSHTVSIDNNAAATMDENHSVSNNLSDHASKFVLVSSQEQQQQHSPSTSLVAIGSSAWNVEQIFTQVFNFHLYLYQFTFYSFIPLVQTVLVPNQSLFQCIRLATLSTIQNIHGFGIPFPNTHPFRLSRTFPTRPSTAADTTASTASTATSSPSSQEPDNATPHSGKQWQQTFHDHLVYNGSILHDFSFLVLPFDVRFPAYLDPNKIQMHICEGSSMQTTMADTHNDDESDHDTSPKHIQESDIALETLAKAHHERILDIFKQSSTGVISELFVLDAVSLGRRPNVYDYWRYPSFAPDKEHL